MAWHNPLPDLTQCTAHVAQLAHETGWEIGMWGDATMWLEAARVRKYKVDSTPMPGAVAVWLRDRGGAGRSGHVAFVLRVEGNQVQVSERNWPPGAGPQERRVPVSQISGFIHPWVLVEPGDDKKRNPVLAAVSWVLFERSALYKTARWMGERQREKQLQTEVERCERIRQLGAS